MTIDEEERKGIWTVETYALHNEAMRASDISHHNEMRGVEERFQTERDKRYTEGNELRAMALKIKETADANALELASESQTYKEARNDAMREQNLKETGVYATRDDLAEVVSRFDKTIKPILDYVSAQKGVVSGTAMTKGNLYTAIGAAIAIIGVIFLLIDKLAL